VRRGFWTYFWLAVVIPNGVIAQHGASRRPHRADAGTSSPAPTPASSPLWCAPSGGSEPRRCRATRESCEAAANEMVLERTSRRTCAPVASGSVCYGLTSVHVRSLPLTDYVCFATAAACETDRARTVADARTASDYDVGACTPALALPRARP
jgi:hypothetical protein